MNNVAEMVADPQVQAREMFVEVDHPVYGPLRTTGTPLKLSETPGLIPLARSPSPASTTRKCSWASSVTRPTTWRAGARPV